MTPLIRIVRPLVALLVATAAVLVPAPFAEAVTRPATLFAEHPVGAGPVEPGFPIDYVSVTFELAEGTDPGHGHGSGEEHEGTEALAVRFRHDGAWGPWTRIQEDGAQAVGQWSGALVAGDDADAYQIRGVPAFAREARAGALNTSDGPEVVVATRERQAAGAVTACKSRADWGADEKLRKGTRSFAPAQVLTVHHTATENDDPDPDARVRAIYEYHVRVNRWDDIGYQALISESGTVYEGRWSGADSPSCLSGSGTGWEFGHRTTEPTSDVVTGAHTGGYNTGNFGVALLGTLTDVLPKPGARAALVEYLAELAGRHGIDPESVVHYDNGTNQADVQAISGHRDFTATECPGGRFYHDDLPVVRTDVAAALAPAGPTVTITAPDDADSVRVLGTSVDVRFEAVVSNEPEPTSWTWTNGDVVLGTTSAVEATLAEGSHRIVVTATQGGTEMTDTIVVHVAPSFDDTVTGETAVAGTVDGTYPRTSARDGVAESVTEIESGGKPRSRYSYLEHRWTFDVLGGSSVTFSVTATTSSSSDGDGFRFEYLAADGTWSRLVLLPPGTNASTASASLPAGTKGTLVVRVVDTVRDPGTRPLDTVSVDHLVVTSNS